MSKGWHRGRSLPMVRQIAKKGTAVLIEKTRESYVQRANSTKLLVLCPLCTIVSNAWRRDPHPVGMLSITRTTEGCKWTRHMGYGWGIRWCCKWL
jgi:hypothetical protein